MYWINDSVVFWELLCLLMSSIISVVLCVYFFFSASFFLFVSGCQLLPVVLAIPFNNNLQLICWAFKNQITKNCQTSWGQLLRIKGVKWLYGELWALVHLSVLLDPCYQKPAFFSWFLILNQTISEWCFIVWCFWSSELPCVILFMLFWIES